MTVVGRSNPPELADLIWTSLKLNRPCGTKFVNPGSHAGAKKPDVFSINIQPD
jgi:hypothetical protein